MNQFVHLHVHTDYSLLDGHSRIPQLVARAAELNQPALAITDHGSLGGIRKFWEECNTHNIKPIIGCEFYVAPESRFTKGPVYWGEPEQRRDDVSGTGAYTHLTVLSTGDEGLRNLFRLHATSYADGFYRKPRIDVDSLGEHNRGLLVTTGCAGGAVATLIRLGQYEKALNFAGTLKDIFGDRLYVELMEHENPIDFVINPTLIDLAASLRLPLVATNDTHYTHEHDARSHDALLCLQTGQRLNGIRSFRFEGHGYHLRSYEEMAAVFPDAKNELRNTLAIADRVEDYGEVFATTPRLPRWGLNPAYELYNRLDWNGDNAERLSYETEAITSKGFEDYFLILADLTHEARRRNIRVGPGRGSVGGSLVAYQLGITDIDPIQHGLIFERFLNPERLSYPDIDIDIDDSRREEFLAIVREKYGEEYVAQIGTYGIIKSKSALHDAARVSGFPRRQSDVLARRLPPPKFGRVPSLDDGDWAGITPEETKTLELARSLEGVIRNQGVHAAGIVISPEPLEGIVPLYKPKGTEPWVTAWDMHDIEAVGLQKMDFLGLQNLGVIDECLHMLRNRKDIGALREVPTLGTNLEDLVDSRTYELLARGDTLGVFQLDGSGMQQLLRSIKPTHFDDVSAVLALYRPGPMGVNAHHSYAKRKNGREGISYPHPELAKTLAPILKETYGLIVYQEQVLQILKEVCGYTYSSAALIFDAMRKKLVQKMLEAKPDFVRRMDDRGYSNEATNSLWDTLAPFADYSFNKSHTVGYGVLSYWTAYLKTNHPNEYMAAVLSREDDADRLKLYMQDIGRMGIDILPPDINESRGGWTPTENGIRYGLSSIKNVGAKISDYLDKSRPFDSLHDFFSRASAKVLNAKTLGSLICAGALDSLCPHREDLYLASTSLAERALSERRVARRGQSPLVSVPYTVSETAHSYNTKLRQQWERELLGTILSQSEVKLTSARWLRENEFYYIRDILSQHPGRQRISLTLGFASVEIGYVDWNDTLARQLKSMGITAEFGD